MTKRVKTRPGFSLLEMVAVVTILGIIAAMAMSRVSAQALDAKKKACLQYRADINSAIEHYYFDQAAYPTQVSDLQGTYYPEAVPNCPVDNSPYLIDGTTHRVQGHNH